MATAHKEGAREVHMYLCIHDVLHSLIMSDS